MEKTKIYVLSTTHWDREWYQSFEEYRFRLVRMVDSLLDILEQKPDYRCFHFDGQTIVLSDYLEIRPQNRARLEALIKAGRIEIGPWYTMPDEFLISGEALVRNLCKGQQVCEALGVTACDNAYICDIFGHNSQMPQIFRGFGLDSTAFFRGRNGYEKSEFLWEGADGSRITVHKQHPDYAYSSFFFVARWPYEDRPIDYKDLAGRVKKYLDAEKKNFAVSAHLMFDGVDHIDPEKDMPQILAALNTELSDYEFIHSNFRDYNALVRKETANLSVEKGCFYALGGEGVNNAVLKNVLSSIVPLKQANDFCESRMTLVTEPMQAYARQSLGKHAVDAQGFLDQAWDYLYQNQCHDSIGGCSITATHLDCENRFKRVKEILASVDNNFCQAVGENLDIDLAGHAGAFAVFNPSQEDVGGTAVVTFEIQKCKHNYGFRFFDAEGRHVPHNILSSKPFMKKMTDYGKLIRFAEYDRMEIVLSAHIPQYSYRTFFYDVDVQERNVADYDWKYCRFDAPSRNIGSQLTGAPTVDNGRLTVTVNPNGTLCVTDKESKETFDNLLMMEDCSDVGEGWNYVPSKFDSRYLSAGSAAQIAVDADFPDLTRFRIELTLTLPKSSDFLKGRNGEREPLCVTNFVTIKKGDSRIGIKTEVTNTHVNHRLRALFPTLIRSDGFLAQLPFDMYRFDIKKQNSERTKEVETAVNPMQGALSLSGGKRSFHLYTKGLYEAAVLDREDTPVCLTLYRSFPNETSEFESVMGKLLCPLQMEYMLDFAALSAGQAVKRANEFKTGLFSAAFKDGFYKKETLAQAAHPCEKLPMEDTVLHIGGGAVLSAYCQKDGQTLLRIYDLDGGCEGKIKFAFPVSGAVQTDLGGKTISAATVKNGALIYKLGSKQIATYRLSFDGVRAKEKKQV